MLFFWFLDNQCSNCLSLYHHLIQSKPCVLIAVYESLAGTETETSLLGMQLEPFRNDSFMGGSRIDGTIFWLHALICTVYPLILSKTFPPLFSRIFFSFRAYIFPASTVPLTDDSIVQVASCNSVCFYNYQNQSALFSDEFSDKMDIVCFQ